MLRDLLRKGDFMVKIDLNDAYFTVPVWRNHQKFLRFVCLPACPSGLQALPECSRNL